MNKKFLVFVSAAILIFQSQSGFSSPEADFKELLSACTQSVTQGNFTRLNQLLSAGANVNIVNEKGNNLVMEVAGFDQLFGMNLLNTVDLLIAKGADLNHVNSSGESILEIVAWDHRDKDVSLLRLLLEHGASTNIDKAFSKASWGDNFKGMILLVEHGAGGSNSCNFSLSHLHSCASSDGECQEAMYYVIEYLGKTSRCPSPIKPASNETIVTSTTGHQFTRINSIPNFGESWKDANGLIWGDVIVGTNGLPYFLSSSEADKYCKNIGGRLPTAEEFDSLAKFMGFKTTGGFIPQILPNMSIWLMSIAPSWSPSSTACTVGGGFLTGDDCVQRLHFDKTIGFRCVK